jgi:hypothetical protein
VRRLRDDELAYFRYLAERYVEGARAYRQGG